MPERFLHICEACGKTEILSSEEAFNAGWDYPPRMGEFGILSPRTCGSCGMTDTLWWKLMNGEATLKALDDKQREFVERVKNEPFSLLL